MTFDKLNLIKPILDALKKSNYIEPTSIQEKAIPEILKQKDLIGIAQTGTGKTAAFTIPILQLMAENHKGILGAKVLILAPTRELVIQIEESIRKYGEFMNFIVVVIFGGVSQVPQVKKLRKKVDIIVATPGRLNDLINQGHLDFSNLKYFVLDEADKMLDMGFIFDMEKIIRKIPTKRQTLFFSATMSKNVIKLTNKYLNNPEIIQVNPEVTTVEKINQKLFYVNSTQKNSLLLNLLREEKVKNAIVFTRTKHKANKIAQFLTENKIKSEAIHGNKSQNARTKTLENFKTGKIKILLATEIVSRGIDINNLTHVINYELPNEPESYVHRIGRTARAGNEGEAYSFCSADERNYVNEIEKLIGQKIPVQKHKYHSKEAEEAKGEDAKPKKKTYSNRNNKKFKPNFKKNKNSNFKFKKKK